VTNFTRKRILLADDHAAMLDEVSSLLRDDYEVVGRVSDGAALVEAAARLKPDLVISDISMPQMTGFEAAAELRKKHPTLPVIFLTVQSSRAYVKKARSLGATGYVLKIHTAEQLRKAVESVLAGQVYFCPDVRFETQR
jgi:DNA-binding NarL/FixJ family response regulator